VIAVRVLSFLPEYRWDVIEAFAELVFMLTIFYAVDRLHRTIIAYEHLAKRQREVRGFE
jgi:hypothetical protein